MQRNQSHKNERDSCNRTFYLPRLPRPYYQGDAVVFWTLPISERGRGWLSPKFHVQFRELMFHTAAREGLVCPIYCSMPDHMHFIWMGLRKDTDQINRMTFLRTYLEPHLAPLRFQHQSHDDVLKEGQRKRSAFAKICFYISANPVRAGLISENETWRYTNCIVPGYPNLDSASREFWPTFWKIFSKLREPDAGNITRP